VERGFHTTLFAIISVVYLCGVAAEGRLYIAQRANQQSRLLVITKKNGDIVTRKYRRKELIC